MLDFVETDLLGVMSNHGRRVAYVTARLTRMAGLSDPQIFDAVALALLHDNGLTEEMLTSDDSKTNAEKHRRAESYRSHCEIGERNVEFFPFLTSADGIIKFHHERYDGKGFYRLVGDDIPQAARIIGLADNIDARFGFVTPDPVTREKIEQYVTRSKGGRISPRSGDLFLEAASETAFWLDLQTPYIGRALKEQTPDIWQDLPWERVLQISNVFSRIVDCKSPFTRRHSSGLEEKAARMAEFYRFDSETTTKFRIAATLHDIGKLAIPNVILDKPGRLTPEEFAKMREHTYYTRRCLEQIQGFDDITEWASNHHERLNGSGYPLGLSGDKLDFNSRLMACLDIYQALTEERPYRRSLSHEEAMQIIRPQVEQGLLDGDVVADVETVYAPSSRRIISE